ncbi:hypothetical protein FF38_12337 [Lucilia cuprina]|uniref:Uncharacterized protein n=1 Tax=Lucilia cuprina TaxID=7375 RepID=A0A0L0C5I7_LUCCU|nr:hypothetical protein FF38_12337 [Lucilia cuprina]
MLVKTENTQERQVTAQLYDLSRSSLQSSLDQPQPILHKAATFELRGRQHCLTILPSSASVGLEQN